MRFVVRILLGLIVFNAILIMTTPFFPIAYEGETPYEAVNVTSDEEYSQYGDFNIDFWGILFGGGGLGFAAMGVSLIGGTAWTLYSKDLKPLGIATFAGLITTLFITASSVLYNLSQNVYVLGLISLIGIIIGILIAFTMAESMMGQMGAD